MNQKTTRLYGFEDFRVDPNQKCLWRGSELVSLTSKAFDTLVVLVENSGKVVSKDTFLNKVWADTFVEESTLVQNISTLRKVFKGKQFIETVPGRGYRFVGDVLEFFEEETIVEEKIRRTHILTEYEEIHNSNPSKETTASASTKSNHSKSLIAAFVLVLITVLIGGIFVFRYYFSPRNAFENKFKQFETTKFATGKNIYRIAFSPDGKYLALVEKNGKDQTLLLKQTTNSNTLEIVPPTKDDIIGVTFSPDSQSIFYTLYQDNNSVPPTKIGTVYKVPILGGTQSEIIKDADSSIAFSPQDPNKIAFIRDAPQIRESSLMIADLNSRTEQKIASRVSRNNFPMEGVSWSPDGKFIVSGVNNADEPSKPYQLVLTDLSTGEQKTISTIHWKWIGQVKWLKDGSGILLVAFTNKSPRLNDEVWLVSYPDGKARQIANGINGLYGFGVSEDGKSIVTVKTESDSNILIKSPNNSEQSFILNKKVGDNGLINLGLETTNDGKIIYSSAKQGSNADIWTIDNDGSNLKQLTDDSAADFSPQMSPDGQYLVFLSNRTGSANLWRMNADGSNLRQLTDLQNTFSPSISPDSKWIYFSAQTIAEAPPLLYKISIEGGSPLQITNLITTFPQISSDGKHIACIFREIKEGGVLTYSRRLTILSAEDGKVLKQFEFPKKTSGIFSLSWLPDNKSISYLLKQDETSDIFKQPIEGGKPTKITNSQSDKVFRYAWFKNSEKMVVEQGISMKEISVMRELPN